MLRALLLFVLAFLTSSPAQDQLPHRPVIGPLGVLHGASQQPVRLFRDSDSPAGIAPGSIFLLKGAYLGPADVVVGTAPFGLRLPDVSGGTEVRVRSLETGEVLQAKIVHAWNFQVAAILPEDFPLGEAEVEVWYSGQASEAVAFPVVTSYPALFTISQMGWGRGVIQNYIGAGEVELNGLTHSARPGQYVTLWGTGLGDARTDEVQLEIAGRDYPASYAGPAPGIEGVDQLNLRLPEDLTARGCYVQILVSVDGVLGSPVSLALSDDGGPCQHPWGLSPERLAEIEAGNRAIYLNLTLTDGTSDSERPQPFITSGSKSVAVGQALSLNESGVESTAATRGFRNNLIPQSRMACPAPGPYPISVRGDFLPGPTEPIPSPPEPANPPVRAAGVGTPWRIAGPADQSVDLEPQSGSPPYDSYFGPAILDSGFFAPGQWSITIPAGSDLGPIENLIQMPELPQVSIPASMQLGEDVEIQWSPAQLPSGHQATLHVRFWGENPNGLGQQQSMGFSCRLNGATGRTLVQLSQYKAPLVGVEDVELTFEVSATTLTAPAPGVDRFEATGTAYRTWTVPLE